MKKNKYILSVCSKERMVKESILKEGLPDINSLFSFGLSTTTMSIDLEDSC
ncbi:hypothetical protein VZ148_19200 [Enterobacter hormaechei]|nr:hypothetical protein [Enterobacter hormaechei]EFJ5910363.1 hypothetical protein [Escherichia coli]MED5732795.1 hypothetical protein [Enterobacter hormaechei]